MGSLFSAWNQGTLRSTSRLRAWSSTPSMSRVMGCARSARRSITCHWCHVMERESFENEAIAAVMNRFFVCIKVDREERPDIDAIYMAAVQMQ